VRAIGRCAVNLDQAAQRCIAVLLELIQTKVNYVVQEAVIVIKVRSIALQDFTVLSTAVHCCVCAAPLGCICAPCTQAESRRLGK
jgi:vesicle coat complex subunit